VMFDTDMKWCDDGAIHSAEFWCEGSLPRGLYSTSLFIGGDTLTVDLSQALQGISRDSDRLCGITFPAEILCSSATSAPFPGIAQGAYAFKLKDTSAPSVIGFNPSNDATQVDPNTVVEFTFSEPIILGPSTLYLTLTLLDTTRSGAASSAVSAKVYSLELPNVRSKDNTILQFDLAGKTNPGWLYSIALPTGAVEDMSGNKFGGLAGGIYTFRTATASFGPEGSSGGGTTGFIIALTVGLVVGGICVATLVWKFQSACYVQSTYRQKDKRPTVVPVPSVKQVQPQTFIDQVDSTDPVTSIPSSFVSGPSLPNRDRGPSKQEAPSRDRGPTATQDVPTVSAGPTKSKMSWARAGSSAPKPERIYPESKPERSYPDKAPAPDHRRSGSRSRAAQPETRSSSTEPQPGAKAEPPPKPEPSSKTATSPVVESTSPEVRAVEKKMREMMNEPLAVRKKMLKDLMLEHHPDKNAGSDSAKEIFQYINGARAWFLHDA